MVPIPLRTTAASQNAGAPMRSNRSNPPSVWRLKTLLVAIAAGQTTRIGYLTKEIRRKVTEDYAVSLIVVR